MQEGVSFALTRPACCNVIPYKYCFVGLCYTRKRYTWSYFISFIKLCWTDYFYQIRSITITNRDPYFISPAIKALLRKRNRLNRKEAVAAADSLTRRIGQRIAEQNRLVFDQRHRGSKQMWDTVRRVTGKETTREYSGPAAEKLNQQFAGIFSNSAYEPPRWNQVPISHWMSFRSMIYSLLLTALNQQPLG